MLNGSTGKAGKRIALYSHDGMGLGHIRRNLLIAQSLIAHQSAHDILLISGAHEASVLSAESGIDCITVPRLHKRADGSYAPHSMNMNLAALVDFRTQAIGAALEAFAPDLFIVDKKARGALGELDSALQNLRATGKTKLVLGLRDVLDEPEAVARDWKRQGYSAAIEDYYDTVWVYGDRAVYDLALEARLPGTDGERFEYTGYFDQRLRLAHANHSSQDLLAQTGVGDDPYVLCLVGGGEDGMPLAESFVRAELPEGMHGIAVLGPFMPAPFRRALYDLAVSRSNLHVLDFVSEPTALIAAAERVICMGGYCAFTEVVSFEKPALIVPRVQPRLEQLIRAERFAELGLVDYLTPDRLAPAALTTWLREETSAGKSARKRIDLGGTERLPRMAEALFNGDPNGHGMPVEPVSFPRKASEARTSGRTTLPNLVQSEQL